MKVYEYREYYIQSLYEILSEGKLKLSEVLFKIECVDEYCNAVGYNSEMDIEKILSSEKTT